MPTSPSNPLDWLRGAAFAVALRLTILGKPVPCPRPRVTKTGRSYYPENYSRWRESALEQLNDPHRVSLTDPLNVALEVIGEAPKKTVLPSPQGDVDNFAKSALDALTKAGVWADDKQVQALLVRKRWAAPGEAPGFSIWIAPATP